MGRQPAALRRGGGAGRGEAERGEEERWRGNRRERERGVKGEEQQEWELRGKWKENEVQN